MDFTINRTPQPPVESITVTMSPREFQIVTAVLGAQGTGLWWDFDRAAREAGLPPAEVRNGTSGPIEIGDITGLVAG